MRWNIRRRSLAAGLLLAAGWAPAQEAQDAPQDATAPDAVSMDSRDRIFYPGDTERWKPLAGKLLGNTLLDQKEIWTSPFHMRRQDVKWWVGIASDIVAGGAMGWFLGRYVYQIHMDHEIHRHLAARPRITPELDPTQRLYGLAVAFGD